MTSRLTAESSSQTATAASARSALDGRVGRSRGQARVPCTQASASPTCSEPNADRHVTASRSSRPTGQPVSSAPRGAQLSMTSSLTTVRRYGSRPVARLPQPSVPRPPPGPRAARVDNQERPAPRTSGSGKRRAAQVSLRRGPLPLTPLPRLRKGRVGAQPWTAIVRRRLKPLTWSLSPAIFTR